MILNQERERKFIDIHSGTLTVTTIKRQRKHVSRLRCGVPDGIDNNEEEFTTQVMLKPKSSPTMVRLQRDRLHGSLSEIPRLIINNILPRDSVVFQVADRGTVEDLLALLDQGKASLHDHDVNSQSLLHVSF